MPALTAILARAAAPSFAVMALLTATHDTQMLCGQHPLTGMVAMYLLMALFHIAAWLPRTDCEPPRSLIRFPPTAGETPSCSHST
jgi:hypothetical protein